MRIRGKRLECHPIDEASLGSMRDDMESVVHCRNCKNRKSKRLCPFKLSGMMFDGNDYCSFGEMDEETENSP